MVDIKHHESIDTNGNWAAGVSQMTVRELLTV